MLEQIVDCAKHVLSELGPTHSEQTYQNALEIEFQDRKIKYQRQPTLTIYYKNKAVGFHRPDLIVGDNIVVELKSRKIKTNKNEEEVGDIWESQINQYVKCLNYQPDKKITFIGMLIVFNLSGNLTIKYSYMDKKSDKKKTPSSEFFENCININLPNLDQSEICLPI